MNPPGATEIRIDDHRTTLSHGAAPEVVVAVGALGLAEGLFRHDRPTPDQIEQAIDRVEDALAATGLKHAVRGDLLTRDPQLHAMLGLRAEGDRVTRDEVELRFQRLASASLGHRGTGDDLPAGPAAAALLILRECMHHLGYEGLRREGGQANDASGGESRRNGNRDAGQKRRIGRYRRPGSVEHRIAPTVNPTRWPSSTGRRPACSRRRPGSVVSTPPTRHSGDAAPRAGPVRAPRGWHAPGHRRRC